MTIAKTLPKLLLSTLVTASIVAGWATQASAQERLLDEVRIGSLVAVDKTETNDERGAFISGMVFFDPWGHNEAQGWEKLIKPRIHVGGNVATADEANQIYAGFSWTANLTDRFFLEGGFGGTLHDGDLVADGTDGPKLGCSLLFHEYAAAGFNLNEQWRVVAHIEHSSHADLCKNRPNNGLSRAGVMIGYKF